MPKMQRTVSLDDDLDAWVTMLASKEDRSYSQMVNRLVRDLKDRMGLPAVKMSDLAVVESPVIRERIRAGAAGKHRWGGAHPSLGKRCQECGGLKSAVEDEPCPGAPS